MDRLSALLERFRVRAHLFHAGRLCGLTHFDAKPGRGFLHVLRRGDMELTHRRDDGVLVRIEVHEPTLLFYPRPLEHDFHNAPADGSDFVCASLDFEGGGTHPLVRALPALVVLPLQQVPGLDASLSLLFAEADQMRCGHRFLADRLFEVVLLQLLRWLLDHAKEAGVSVGLMAGLSDTHLALTLTALHEQPRKAWRLQDMAAQAGMSRSAFAAKFKVVLGQTPADYLADWRMSLAQAHLRHGHPVKLIASELGYANASALSRVFAQRLGASPTAWKKESLQTSSKTGKELS
ncbi:AraC family transcriptional regulator [Rhodoferax sp.]|uniref:AraC family transcriptional regulator n=1 Tax=Rhodoferax sp. TaxID=50421 RepID=UPI0027587103|nr:AraC family transcriptional regulator [Rhodoferax sp.]